MYLYYVCFSSEEMEGLIVDYKFGKNKKEIKQRCKNVFEYCDTYKYYSKDEYKIGDAVVTTTRYGISLGFIIAKEPVSADKDLSNNQEILVKIDLTKYLEKLRKKEQKAKLMLEMEKLKEKISYELTFKKLAEESEEMKQLFDKYNSL
jgi:hypothetical protein